MRRSLLKLLALSLTFGAACSDITSSESSRTGRYVLARINGQMLPILFFGTPIVWFPAMLDPERSWIAAANPIFAFIDLIRSPLLGSPPLATSWPVALLVTAASATIAAIAFGRYRDRVAYWV